MFSNDSSRPIIAYGSSAFITAEGKVWDRLQVIQNKAIKAALPLPMHTSTKYIHNESKLPRTKDLASMMQLKKGRLCKQGLYSASFTCEDPKRTSSNTAILFTSVNLGQNNVIFGDIWCPRINGPAGISPRLSL